MSPLTVLYGVESMELAGAEQVVLSLVTRLDRARFRPVVCCLTEKGVLSGRLEALGVPVVALGKRPGLDLPILARLRRVMRAYEVDIVHTHVWPANVWCRLAAKLAGVPILLVTEHNVELWKRRTHMLVDRWLARATDRVICVSDAVRTFYRDQVQIPSVKLVRIHNGIDPAPFAAPTDRLATRAALGIGPREPVLIIVARLLPQKAHEYFLEALKLVHRAHPATWGLIVGDGPTRDALEALGRDLGLQERIRFLGERTDVPELLQASDVFVLSSAYEGLPLSALEAMAAGKPAVVTDVGGNREAVLDGVTGFVVPPRDPQALAARLTELLSHPARAAAMGAAGRQRVLSEFRLEHMAEANQQVYEAVAREKRLLAAGDRA